MTYICYLITNGSRTYVGITNNFARRLRQHNGEISGGARSTSRRAIEGQPWRFAACVRNIAEHNDALSYEKCVHLASRPGRNKVNRGRVCGVENRQRIMQDILARFKQGQYTNKTTGQVRNAADWEFTLENPLASPPAVALPNLPDSPSSSSSLSLASSPLPSLASLCPSSPLPTLEELQRGTESSPKNA